MNKKELRHESYHRYRLSWGNYKSDKHKSMSLLKEEIRTILSLGTFTKTDLVVLKNTIKRMGFRGLIEPENFERWQYGPSDLEKA